MSSSSSRGSSTGTNESSVHQAWPVKPKCVFLVKGGGVDDEGAMYKMSFDSPFHKVYVDYANRVGVRPSNLRFVYRGTYVSPDNSPHDMGFWSGDIILAYNQDGKTPISVNPSGIGTGDWLVFTIHEMTSFPDVRHHRYLRTTKVKDVLDAWGRSIGSSAEGVSLILDGVTINNYETLADAKVYDGAILYGNIKPGA